MAQDPTAMKIKISKAKADLVVDFQSLPVEVQLYIVEQGLSKVLNSATAKETAATTPDETQRGLNAMGLAEKKLDSLKAGKLVARKSSGDGKTPAVVMTEARRLAKNIVKAGLKAKGKKISDFTAKAITEAANLYLADHKELVDQAKASIDAAAALAASAEVNVDAIPVDPVKVAAREKANADKRAETAAKNAGKPGGQASTTKKQAGVSSLKAPPRRPAPQPTA